MAKTVESRLKVSLLDGVTAPATAAGEALDNLHKKSSWSSRLGGAATAAGTAVGTQLRRVRGAANEFTESLMGPAGIAAGLAAITQGETYVKFTENMNRIGAATRASAEDMDALKRKIFEVSAAHARGYDDISEGALALIKTGKSVDETMGALDAVVGASVAVERSVDKTAGSLTDVVYGMGYRVSDQQDAMSVFANVADIATAASYKFNQSYDGMMEGLAKGAPMARIAGLSLIDITTMLGVLADAGFKGEEGGTAFASSLLRMMNPSKKANAELKAANLNLKQFTKHTGEAQLGAKQLTDALSEETGIDASRLIPRLDKIVSDPRYKSNAALLGQKLQEELVSGLSMDANSPNIDKVKDGVNSFIASAFTKVDVRSMIKYLADKHADENMPLMKELFGVNQAPKMIALINDFQSGLYDRQHAAMEEMSPGAVSIHAQQNMQGLSGAVRHLASAWKLLGGRIFDVGGAAQNLTAIINRVADALTAFAQANPAILKFAGYLGTAFAAAAPLGIAISALSIPLKGLQLGVVAALAPVRALGFALRAASLASLGIGGGLIAGLAAWTAFNWDGLKTAAASFSSGFFAHLKIPDGLSTAWNNLATKLKDATSIDLTSWKSIGTLAGTVIADGINIMAKALEDVLGIINGVIDRWGAFASFVENNKLTRGLGIAPGAAPSVAGAKASGGPVIGGKSYLVGEKGPELFTPGSSGSILPHGAPAGARPASAPINQTVNITIHSAVDLRTIVGRVKREVADAANAALRTAQADIGLTWS